MMSFTVTFIRTKPRPLAHEWRRREQVADAAMWRPLPLEAVGLASLRLYPVSPAGGAGGPGGLGI